jgi:HrpA-like RNA helicase
MVPPRKRKAGDVAASPKTQASVATVAVSPSSPSPASSSSLAEVAEALAAERRRLPAWEARAAFLRAFGNTDTLVLTGETGCGKTTQIPQFLLAAGYGQQGCVGVTQPRRVAAMSVARRVAAEMGEEVGGRVGYHVRFDERTSAATTLRYMTDGMLLREAVAVPSLRRYSVVVVDEAHERSLQTDMMLALLRRAQAARRKAKQPPLKILVMSATLDTATFCEYFGGAPAVQISGRQFPVAVRPCATATARHRTPPHATATATPPRATARHRTPPHATATPPRAAAILRARFHRHRPSVPRPSIAAVLCPLRQVHYTASAPADYLEAAATAVMQIHLEEVADDDRTPLSLVSPPLCSPSLPPPAVLWQACPGDVLCFLPGQDDIDAVAASLRHRWAQLSAADAGGEQQSGTANGHGSPHGAWHTGGTPPPALAIHALYAALPPTLQLRALQPAPAGTRKVILATNIAETSLTIDGVVHVVDTGLAKVRMYHPGRRIDSLLAAPISKAAARQRAGRAGRQQPGQCFRLFTEDTYTTLSERNVPEIQRTSLSAAVLALKVACTKPPSRQLRAPAAACLAASLPRCPTG